MNYDEFGVANCVTEELCNLLYKNPDLDLSNFLVKDVELYNSAVKSLYAELPLLKSYVEYFSDRDPLCSVDEFDAHNQNIWFMPDKYKSLDVAKWVLDQCKEEAELQRVGQELLLYQERNLFDLLKFLKYLVDILRENNIVWGVGRGSSVASFVLYLIGVHRINSLHYDLPIEEFLK
jgi:DNA polymerase III alpha subunit